MNTLRGLLGSRRPICVLPLAMFAAMLFPHAGWAEADAPPSCVHPHPCGDEWSDGLERPFQLKEIVEVDVASHDGVLLHGWIGLPDVPDGIRVPVALHSSPYFGTCYPLSTACRASPDEPGFWTNESTGLPARPGNNILSGTWGVPPIELVRRGFATAFFSVRGTGNSGGCFEFGGTKEQRDHAVLIDWLAGRMQDGSPSPAATWSNGRIGMGGLSWPAGTALQGAISGNSALKTVIIGGFSADFYNVHFTPQGAAQTLGAGFRNQYLASVGVLPPMGSGAGYGIIEHLPVTPERLCPEIVASVATPWQEVLTDHRDGTFYDERRLLDRFDDVSAAVLVAHGFRDYVFHSELWDALADAPKRVIKGYWGHQFPVPGVGTLDPNWESDTWSEIVLAWLDYWLWGIGPAPERLDRASFQDQFGTWRESSAWPPAEARDEVMYLGGDALSPVHGGGSRSFRSAPNILNSYRGATEIGFPFRPWDSLCPHEATRSAGTSGLLYVTEPRSEPVTIAGSPFAYLRLTSDLPGGIVTVKLIDIGPQFSCAGGQPTDVRFLSGGAADLRFHGGGFDGRDFPVGSPTNVRVDLFDLADTVQPGHRLALEVSYGETHAEWTGQPYFPQITVHSEGGPQASHVLLPIAEGTLGGPPPTVEYPPRPFVP